MTSRSTYLSLLSQTWQVTVFCLRFEQYWMSWKWLESWLSDSFSFSQSQLIFPPHSRDTDLCRADNLITTSLQIFFDIPRSFLVPTTRIINNQSTAKVWMSRKLPVSFSFHIYFFDEQKIYCIFLFSIDIIPPFDIFIF